MPRVIWKGAISFGLVHIPVAVYPASTEDDIDFDWLDKRNMDPVGYQRINKRTGKAIEKDNIVKGIKYDEGQYVVLSDDEIKNAYPRTTQTIEIEAFVRAQDIPFVHLERPYYLAPINKGEKVYALLRETLVKQARVGVARVVLHSKQHLAALIPVGPALMLNLLRWPNEIRPWTDLKLPAEGAKAAGVTERELTMASQLVDDMSTDWDPDAYKDQFREAVMALVDKKVEAGEVKHTQPLEDTGGVPTGPGANVIDLTELLKRSLGKRPSKADAPAHAPAAKKATRKRAS